jgi:hypothetical protein
VEPITEPLADPADGREDIAGWDETDFHTYRTRPNGPKFNKPSDLSPRRAESGTARSRTPGRGRHTVTLPPP